MESRLNKKEMTSLIENARLRKVNGQELYVVERLNEQGFICTYKFPEDMREEILRRINHPKRQKDQCKWGKSTQEKLTFLKKHKELIQVLFDIQYLMKARANCTVREACRVLFKDKKKLPSGFYRKSVTNYYPGADWNVRYCIGYSKEQHYSVESFINLLPILPKTWLEGIEK